MAEWPDDQFDAFVADRLSALVAFAFGLSGDLGLSQDLTRLRLGPSRLLAGLGRDVAAGSG
jgi:hypothetical protein